MDRFLDKYKLSKLKQEDIKILNNSALGNETKEVILKTIKLKTKSQEPMEEFGDNLFAYILQTC